MEAICQAASFHETSRPFDEEPTFNYLDGSSILAFGIYNDNESKHRALTI